MNYSPQRLPPVSRDANDILNLFGPPSHPIQRSIQSLLQTNRPIIGVDLEFNTPERYTEVPTILGVSDGHLNVSVPFDDGIGQFQQLVQRVPNLLYVGHFFISADLFAFRNVNIHIRPEDVIDTSVLHYLTSLSLCKGSGKVEDQDGAKRGQGYMNLWAFASIHTSLPNWKQCKGKECDGTYCYKHDEQGYNGIDALAPVLALPSVIRQSRLRNQDKLVTLHRDLTYVLAEMSRYGVQIDVPYVHELNEQFTKDKLAIEEQLSFNIRSNPQSIAYFKGKGVVLGDWQETTIRETLEEEWDDELALSLEWKEMGNGTDRWFAPVKRNAKGDWVGYMDERGKVHPRLGIFTSTGRFNAVSPNLQNVSKRRIDRKRCECGVNKESHPTVTCEVFRGMSLGKKVRRAIIASPGHYLLKADYSNAENRMFLFLGGHRIPDGTDLHQWVAETMKLTPEMEFCVLNGSPREAAKTAQHGSFYCEGIQLKTTAELRTGRLKEEVNKGVRIVYPNWTFNQKVVTFTGANLAQRAFGDKTWPNRLKAQAILKALFDAFPGARHLQQRISQQIEKAKAVITPHKYYLSSFGQDEERIKTAAAMYGSNPIAHLTKLALVTLWKAFEGGRPMRPILQVHDEILCEVREDVDPVTAAGWLREAMEIKTPEIPGLTVPTDSAYGSNWRDTRKLK